MKLRQCCRILNCTGRITVLFLVSVAVLFVPQNSQAQNVPPVGKPQIVGSWCPNCKKYFDIPNGKMPSACPHCRFSFVENTKPISPVQGQSPWQMKPSVPSTPADDRLYYDGEITRGGLQTRHFESNGLAAKAEAWGKEMKQINEQSLQNQQAQNRTFENDKNALLNRQTNGTALRQLKNVFADDSAWDSPSGNDPNVVDLRHLGDSSGTPDLLRKNEPVGASILNPLAEMSDERLEKKREALTKSIGEIQKLLAENSRGYADVEAGAVEGKAAAWQAVQDAGTTVAFGALQTAAEKKAASSLWKAIDVNKDLPPGVPALNADKIAALQEARDASRAVKTVEGGSGVSDVIGLAQVASSQDAGEKIAAVAPVASGLMVKSPLGAVPGVVKTGFDTGLVWTDYFVLNQEYARQEELRKQHEANLRHLTEEQKKVIKEQNRRTTAASGK